MRQQLPDTATELFVERGFDAVRVSEVAKARGDSEKIVFTYFPTKESLILDGWDVTVAALRTGLADPNVSPLDASLRILDDELGASTSWTEMQEDPALAGAKVRRFGALIETTPALRAYQAEMLDQLIA